MDNDQDNSDVLGSPTTSATYTLANYALGRATGPHPRKDGDVQEEKNGDAVAEHEIQDLKTK